MVLYVFPGSDGRRGPNSKGTGDPVLFDSSAAFVHASDHSSPIDDGPVIERKPLDVNQESAPIMFFNALRVVVTEFPRVDRLR